MSLTKDQLSKLCEIAKEAALSAGAIIAAKQGSEIEVQSKVGGENLASCVVTEIDLKAQDAILKILGPTLNKYNLGLLTEESTDDRSRFEHDYFWCIDPLDGTLAFSRNQDGYSTSIALTSKSGVPIIGVVYNPRSNDLYSAIKDHGAFKNNKKLTVTMNTENLTLLFDQSYLKHPDYDNQIDQLRTNINGELIIHPLGGAVMNGISTIEMAPAFYYKFPKKVLGGGSLWDFAASSVIQSEAGGFNSDYHQNPLDLNRSDSTFMNHRGAIYCSSKALLKLIPSHK
ncbi:MAG: fructose-1,6-bisphosphatase/inositol monophosphatase family enzyme [Thermoproteota archaeon]|jgi:fructose-1,6-bisphosphatase/inositol monophosphatase family enzyme